MINRLVLGTVQFGLKYGINNKYGKPSREYSLKILDKAYELGIRIFDTAFAYGDAEDVLGEWISARGNGNDIKVTSKLKPNIFENGTSVKQIIHEQVYRSLERLNIDHLDGYLLHTPEYVYRDDILEGLIKCKNSKIISRCGVSIYNEEEALYAADSGLIDYIQVPYSFLDQRLDKTDFYERVNRNHKTVFARSPFVQGLVFMDNEAIPESLKKAKKYLDDFDRIIAKYNLSRQAASILFSLNHPGNDYIVFGVDTIEQLIEDCGIVMNPGDIKDCVVELKRSSELRIEILLYQVYGRINILWVEVNVLELLKSSKTIFLHQKEIKSIKQKT